MRRTLKSLAGGLGVIVGIFLLLQLVPYGRTHSNPPTIVEPAWDELARYAGRRTSTGMMPPQKYRMAHPEADLTPAERMELARGLEATLGGPDLD